MAGWKWFNHDRRVQLETLLRAGHSKREVAQLLGCHISTVYRELRIGDCVQLNYDLKEYHVYSAYAADDRSRKRRRNCGAPLKAAAHGALLSYISRHIKVERRSPAWVAASLRGSDLGYLCEDAIYRYLRRGLLDARPSDLPEHGIRKHPWKQDFADDTDKKKSRYGTSIEHRPQIISDRTTFGHWEMDSVIGKIYPPRCSIIAAASSRVNFSNVPVRTKVMPVSRSSCFSSRTRCPFAQASFCPEGSCGFLPGTADPPAVCC